MKILFLGGQFPQNRYDEIIAKSKSDVQFAANNFQQTLYNALRVICPDDVYMISAPFVNAFPKGYKDIVILSWKNSKREKYVGFNNIWGYRNISRYLSLKKVLSEFISYNDKQKYIIIYSPHVPLIKAANYAVQKDCNIKTILILPDLPQFVMLRNDAAILYKILKPLDIHSFYHNIQNINAFILLTKQMNDIVNKQNKPFLIIEGVASYKGNESFHKKGNPIRIAYTGTLHERYGIRRLIDAFSLLPKNAFCLDICGCGDSQNYVEEAINKIQGINYYGQRSSGFCTDIQMKADILVNPRTNNGEYTKYSFPSKNLEYLSTGNPVICYKLDGIPNEYDKFFFYPKNNSVQSLADTIYKVSTYNDEFLKKYKSRLEQFFTDSKGSNAVAQKIISFILNLK